MLNIVIPMAGRGSRFAAAGYTVPKPLIPVHGIPMIRLVIENLRPSTSHRFIFICQRAHVGEYHLRNQLAGWSRGGSIIELDGITEGAACTVLAARELINNEDPLMIANSDQYVDMAIDNYLAFMTEGRLDGLIMTMQASDPKWSFAGLSANGLVDRVVEKQPISTHATVGIYNFSRGSDFVQAAESMVRKDLRVNNEFYVAPVYNEVIAAGARIGVYDIGAEGEGMYGLGIPTDLDAFLALPLSRQATARLK
jgi:NDP-sugar pyrophosphorylase family protein